MVGVNKLWYKMTVNETLAFFAINPSVGLTDNEVETRAKKFGYNNPSFINRKLQPFFKYKCLRSATILKVPSNRLVLGDIVMLKKGDIAPANLRLVKVRKFSVNEENITGSAGHVSKNTFLAKSLLPIDKQRNMVFAGSVITRGVAYGLVVSYAKTPPSKVAKNELARNLSKNNIILNSKLNKNDFKKIDTVVFDDLRQEYEVIKSLQKIYLEKRITCVYFLDNLLIKRLRHSTPEATIVSTNQIDVNLRGVIFVREPSANFKTKIISILTQGAKSVLYAYRGEDFQIAALIANASLVTTSRASQQAMLKASLVTDRLSISGLASILYNKK